MTDTKISDLPAGVIETAQELVVNDAGTSKKIAVGQMVAAAASAKVHYFRGFLETNAGHYTPGDGLTFSDVCTGEATGSTLTTTADLSGMGAVGFAGILKYGASYKYVPIVALDSTTATTEMSINNYFDDLPAGTLTFTLFLRHDAITGQHLSDAGSRAYAEAVYNLTATQAARDAALAGYPVKPNWESAPWNIASPQFWQVYGGLAGNKINFNSPANLYNPTTKLIHATDNYAVKATTSAQGHGVHIKATINSQPTTVQFTTGFNGTIAQRRIKTTVLLDDEIIYEKITSNTLYNHTVSIYGGQEIEIRVQQDDAVATESQLNVGELVLLATSTAATPPISDNSKIMLLGDSWFDEQGFDGFPGGRPGFAEHMRLLTGGTVNTDYGVGETSSVYGEAWIETALAAVMPDTVIVSYFVNDRNSIDGTDLGTKIGPDGELFDINVDSYEAYIAAMSNIILACTGKATNVVVCLAQPVASESSMANQTNSSPNIFECLGNPVLLHEAITEATEDEIASVLSYHNTRGKYAGRTLYQVENDTLYYATGSADTDTWKPFDAAGAAIAPA